MIVGNIIPRNALIRPDETAIVCDGAATSFAEHAARVYRLANALIEGGLGRQERISVCARNCPEYLEVYGAGEVTGFVVNTVNVRLAAPEMRFVLADADPAVVFFEAAFTEAIAAVRGDLPGVRRYVRIGEADGAPDWCEPYEAVLASGSPARPAWRPVRDDTTYLMYTSGTTGRPKGCMLGQRQQWLTGLTIGYEVGIRPSDRWLLSMPLFHVGAKYWQLAFHIAGATIHIHRRFDAEATVAAIERERITMVHFAPTMIQDILDLPGLAGRDLSSLHTITYGAAAMPVPLLRRALAAFGPILVQRYGGTESAAVSALDKHQHVVDGTPEQVRRLASAGQPNAMTEVRIAREDGSDCAPGEPGELLIHNPDLVMQGYWRNAEATRAALRDGWFHSGDIATLDASGFITIVDRRNDMIVSGGENVYPREVEDALLHHAAVDEAAVIGIPDERWGQTVLAFVVANGGDGVTEAALIEHCRTRIASYKKPSAVVFVDALPKLASGKIDKRSLKAPYWTDHDRQVV